jgi:ADP-ribosyl-[dinitrogen reductase] hydrolase
LPVKSVNTMENLPLLDRFKGSIVGFATGDALGAPLEGMTSGDIEENYGLVTDFMEGPWGSGGLTARTQMMVCVAQAILEQGRFDRTHSSMKMGEWIRASDEGVKEARAPEPACETACRNIYLGESSREYAVESASCGAAVRAAPVGLRYYHEPEELRRSAVAQAHITHAGAVAAAASAAIARAVSLGISDEGDLDGAGTLEHLSGFVRMIDQGMSVKLAGLANYLGTTTGEGFRYTGTGPGSAEAVPAALLAFLLSPYDFEQTVVTAANAGGDTASIAAMAASVSGSFNGMERMPARWREAVEGQAYLESIAFRLYTLTPARGPKVRPPL